ncbi:UDP-glucose 4-epimerase GalE [Burkholderia pseudomultivorans]|uniref:UDP-glucose 4-epimerase n=1 Tax=Burkholderia pseudomultivorans TaxID=1207504 RepID=A0A6P2K452_9BURK|nr:UDP-glucose 4-epimerase GalE [Burkholderia pseudomultivorans]MDR8726605.1 UDP-glucose 4-epimerase [Burkholderia pseudomultivorans]MDR8736438.1 UDP-glucose 4-epimerase [Burkholderia pseudomultivorans]MDR8742252.1 UDP-glucose 4-epimerase [Burkholderia pseudomultivorans]MDR8754036.1 UDP-glucose 4-epimerase [Burkholderia pseudomultivorans]MDR8778854.1 UDP-glucose 4-epimerase [Burkholderia pseudomultivorans]
MTAKGTILVTGGAGYIGSHTAVELLDNGYDVVIVDNLVNSKAESVRRIERITGKTPAFHQVDVCDEAALAKVFDAHPITGTIHFAALKAVGESVAKPLEYYQNNIGGLLAVLKVMRERKVRQFVFSSSATVYGVPERSPIDESFPLSATNPYGQSKLIAEQILRDLEVSDPSWRIATLRYFNPVGAHASGLIGEDPAGIPNNLMPYVAQVAVGKLEKLRVFGSDYPTPDGTGVRDYIHVVDLAKGHIAALDALVKRDASFVVNLGTGQGYSVLEVVRAFEKASGRPVPYELVARRPGDIAECYANPQAAADIIGWRATLGIEEMCADHWRWQEGNPRGFV